MTLFRVNEERHTPGRSCVARIYSIHYKVFYRLTKVRCLGLMGGVFREKNLFFNEKMWFLLRAKLLKITV